MAKNIFWPYFIQSGNELLDKLIVFSSMAKNLFYFKRLLNLGWKNENDF